MYSSGLKEFSTSAPPKSNNLWSTSGTKQNSVKLGRMLQNTEARHILLLVPLREIPQCCGIRPSEIPRFCFNSLAPKTGKYKVKAMENLCLKQSDHQNSVKPQKFKDRQGV